MPRLVVVGCPSADRVHVHGVSHDVVGGAGFLTAVAARATGATVGLVATVPRRLPDAVAEVFGPGGIDRGGLVAIDGVLPSFHIVYDDAGEATYVRAEAGVEAALGLDVFPDAWLDAACVHVSPLAGSTEAQIAFVDGLRRRGFRGLISAGTFPAAMQDEPALVLELLLRTDFFFLNRREAAVVLPEGPPKLHRGVVCVTEGKDGVTVHGGTVTRVGAPPAVDVVDPTGAGDAFCGGFLGATVQGLDGLAAGPALATHSLSAPGGAALLELVARGVEPRVVVDTAAVARLAPFISAAASGAAFDFCGGVFPERDDPRALDILAWATAHQYGFWTTKEHRWAGPMDASLEGTIRRGSEFVWRAFTRAAHAEPDVLDPMRSAVEPELIDRICAADDGACPLPALESHRVVHQGLGRALVERFPGGWSDVLAAARTADDPAAAFLEILSELPGFREDPLAKKARLLVLILSARPERFLGLSPTSPGPIVDYHLMRGCLRTGIVRVVDPALRRRLVDRTWIDGPEEAEIRTVCAEALDALELASGRTVGEIDAFFFRGGRTVCLQQEPPRCDACPARTGCAREVELFQPVFRTTAY